LAGAWIADDPRKSRAGNYLGRGPHAARIADMPARRSRWAGRRAGGAARLLFLPGGERKRNRSCVIGKRDWDTDPTASVEQLVDSAPTTLRPSDPLEKAQQLLQKPDHAAVLVTDDSDGKLLGAFLGASNNEEAGRKQQGRNQSSGLDEDRISRDARGSKRHFAGFICHS
jgi:hypothetical protein